MLQYRIQRTAWPLIDPPSARLRSNGLVFAPAGNSARHRHFLDRRDGVTSAARATSTVFECARAMPSRHPRSNSAARPANLTEVPSRTLHTPCRGPLELLPSRSAWLWGSNPRWRSRPFRNRTFILAPAAPGRMRVASTGWRRRSRFEKRSPGRRARMEAVRFCRATSDGPCRRSGASFNGHLIASRGLTTATTASLAASFRLLNIGNIEQRFY